MEWMSEKKLEDFMKLSHGFHKCRECYWRYRNAVLLTSFAMWKEEKKLCGMAELCTARHAEPLSLITYCIVHID